MSKTIMGFEKLFNSLQSYIMMKMKYFKSAGKIIINFKIAKTIIITSLVPSSCMMGRI